MSASSLVKGRQWPAGKPSESLFSLTGSLVLLLRECNSQELHVKFMLRSADMMLMEQPVSQERMAAGQLQDLGPEQR